MNRKIRTEVRLIAPCYTGSSEKTGNVSLFRKVKCLLPNPIITISRFASEKDREVAMSNLVYLFYKNVDKALKTKENNYYYNKLFHNFTVALSGTTTTKEFFSKVAEACQIETFKKDSRKLVMKILDSLHFRELAFMINNEGNYFKEILHEQITDDNKAYNESLAKKEEDEENREKFTYASKLTAYKLAEEVKNCIPPQIKEIEVLIPQIAGNSFKGIFNDLVKHDWAYRIGGEYFMQRISEKSEGASFDIETYYKLFCGGNINSSTGTIRLSERERLINMCPAIKFGTATGDGTVESAMATNYAYFRCLEKGTGELNSYDLLGSEFITRKDKLKTQHTIRIADFDEKGKPQQMIVFIEVVKPGAVFDTMFELKSYDKVTSACFFAGLKLLKEHRKIGGKTNVGFGEGSWHFFDEENKELTIEALAALAQPYYDYLEKHKAEILNYFNVEVKLKPVKETAPKAKGKGGKVADIDVDSTFLADSK